MSHNWAENSTLSFKFTISDASAKRQFLDATADRQLEAGQRIEKFPLKEK